MTTFLPSPYFTPGRQGATITDIVLHWMDGTLAATDGEFTHGARRVSAHYGIEGTTVHQYVRTDDTAWHAGDWGENTRSIGIEHSAQPGRDATPATIATSIALIVTLCREYGIDPSHIYPHNKFFATACPGTLPLAAMVAAVRAQLGAAPIVTPPPVPAPVHPVVPTPVPSGGLIVRTIDLRNAGTTLVTGPGIVPLQRLLAVAVDGKAGPQTRAALVAYQTRAGLAVDAIFGPATASALLAGK